MEENCGIIRKIWKKDRMNRPKQYEKYGRKVG